MRIEPKSFCQRFFSVKGETMKRFIVLVVVSAFVVLTTAHAPPASAQTSCPNGESTMLAFTPRLASDGRYSASDLVPPSGFTNLVFDGQEWWTGPSVVRLWPVGRVATHSYVQGTWWALCSSNPGSVAIRMGQQKSARNPGLPVRVIQGFNAWWAPWSWTWWYLLWSN